jgi:hypothetical protein
MKELRFSIQCGASNRKALVARRCSQCSNENNEIELNEIPLQHQLIHRSLSTTSVNLQTPKHRVNVERTSDANKFDTLLMLASERTNYLDARRKKYFTDPHNDNKKRRYLSLSPQRKDVPLVLIEQQTLNHASNVRSHQVRFSANAGMMIQKRKEKKNRINLFLDSSTRSSLQIPHYEDDDGDPNAADISSASTSSTNHRPLPRVSRL